MIRIQFKPEDHYWIVGGNGPHKVDAKSDLTGDASQVWSSRRDTYVRADDAEYVKWREANRQRYGFDLTTRIDTEANLGDVLQKAGVPFRLAKKDA
jgi:hypothetical protein